MRTSLFMSAIAALAISGCDNSPVLTQEAFVAAVKKCRPIDARFIIGSQAGARPSVEITVPNSASTILGCMTQQFGEARRKHIRINYVALRD